MSRFRMVLEQTHRVAGQENPDDLPEFPLQFDLL